MRNLLALIALAGLAGTAAANDSVAEVGAGGLVLRQSADIDMVSEDLFVSMHQVRVRYVFRNRSPRDIRTTVAFPLPDHDLRDDFYGMTERPRDFRTLIGGRPVAMQVELRAVVGDTDHTDLLNRLGVPISYGSGDILVITRALSALPAADRERLVALGVAEPVDEERPDNRLTPAWTVRETWHWEQLFPAGRDLRVEHLYRPGVGGTTTSWLGDPDLDASEDGRAFIAEYCLTPDFLARVRDLRGRIGRDHPAVSERWIRYILTTGANWRSPIGDFRLVVDQGSARNLAAFCGEGARRIGPTRWELRRRNWRPDRDLDVLIVMPEAYSR